MFLSIKFRHLRETIFKNLEEVKKYSVLFDERGAWIHTMGSDCTHNCKVVLKHKQYGENGKRAVEALW